MKKYILILPIIALLLSSCGRMMIKLYNIKSPIQKKAVWEKDDRTIIFLPMIHLSKQAYYDEVKLFVTQKRKEGYIIYFEGIKEDTTLTKAERDTVQMKFRKILGFNLFKGKTYKENMTLPYKVPKKYVGQTLENTGIDPKIDINADLSSTQFIEQFEAEFGKIVLDSCDFATPLDEIYRCKRTKKNSYSIRSIRDNYINKLLLNTSDKKIVLVYGNRHRTFIDACIAHKMNFNLIEGKSIAAKKVRQK